MSETTPRKPRQNHLSPDELREVNARRNQAGNQPRTERVNRRLAARLVTYGWKVYAPDGTRWTSTEEYEEGGRQDFHKI